jgi:large subunit ribosomal protein L1
MEEDEIITKIEQIREHADERNFTQSFDFVITLKDVDLNDPSDQVDAYLALPHDTGDETRFAALIGPELEDDVEGRVDTIIRHKDFDDYADDSKTAKNLAQNHDFFLAQADIMPDVATTFGRYLGPRDKMPNPQLGTVINPGTDLESLCSRLKRTIHLKGKKDPVVQVKVGDESMDDEAVASNVVSSYDELLDNLAKERNNIKDAYLKLTMSKPVEVL